ncbi:MAG: hypothetical protein D3910_18950 [Candidatus Electrothrix sp. ATG2]|nr:hypothetical protein [Candidatus Electrothrix sp. ATG2]
MEEQKDEPGAALVSGFFIGTNALIDFFINPLSSFPLFGEKILPNMNRVGLNKKRTNIQWVLLTK